MQAAKAAGVSHATVYSPPWKQDVAFQAEWETAKEMAADLLQSEAFKRAAFGVRKPAGWYKGKPGGYVREYSDILAIFLLSCLLTRCWRHTSPRRRIDRHRRPRFWRRPSDCYLRRLRSTTLLSTRPYLNTPSA